MDLTGYAPNVTFSISKRGYTVKTVEDSDELLKTLRLRHEVFYREYIGIEEDGVDFDSFDMTCDHLVILHDETQLPVGTYRFRSSKFTSEFYTATEFECSSFTDLPNVKLEMGRACIHKDHRNGAVMNLLFRGLAEYIKKTDTELLFGCSSVKCEDPTKVARLMKTLEKSGAISTEWEVKVLEKYKMSGFQEEMKKDSLTLLSDEEYAELLPGLLSAYVRAGSRIVGAPAHDIEFGCVDLFTVLSVDNLVNLFRKKYMGNPGAVL